MNFCYDTLASESPEILIRDVSSTGQSVEAPLTPSVSCPSIAEPSLETHTHATEHLANPNPCNEYLIDDEGLYIDLGPQNSEPTNPHSQQREPKTSQSDTCYDSDSDDESSSDEEDEVEYIDEIVIDREPAQKPETNYNKMDPLWL